MRPSRMMSNRGNLPNYAIEYTVKVDKRYIKRHLTTYVESGLTPESAIEYIKNHFIVYGLYAKATKLIEISTNAEYPIDMRYAQY